LGIRCDSPGVDMYTGIKLVGIIQQVMIPKIGICGTVYVSHYVTSIADLVAQSGWYVYPSSGRADWVEFLALLNKPSKRYEDDELGS
jgi:hypothetical protein